MEPRTPRPATIRSPKSHADATMRKLFVVDGEHAAETAH